MFTLIAVSVVSILFVFALMVAYHTGKFANARESSITLVAVTKTMQDMFGAVTKMQECLVEVNKQQTLVIESFKKENVELRDALEEIQDFGDDEDDDEDEDVLEDGVVTAVAAPAKQRLDTSKSAAHTALVLHDRLQATDHVLDSLKDKLDPNDYILLKSTLISLDKKNAN